jgi:L,D-transpeptidase-like protein
MKSCLANSEDKHTALRRARVALAGLALLISAEDHAVAAGARSEPAVQSIESRTAGDPIMAVVSLRSQRITIYDTTGWILRAPVSSGQKGRETPAGIFSVLQKDAEHYSNLYEDGYMPHMQRLTWSGIALHGGSLPGYPASHGCVRMPFAFAARLFDKTQLGMRVIVAPGDAVPFEIAHPTLFPVKSEASALAAARAAEADEAGKKANQARLAAVAASQEAARTMMPVRVAENLKLRAEQQLATAEAALLSATSAEARAEAEDTKTKALDRIAELRAQWAAAKAELQPKLDAVAPARAAAAAAEAVRVKAAQAAEEAARELDPVSVFISRKTQRLYVRRAFAPIWESPVTILQADRPMGTHLFTAMERTNDDSGMRWSVVTLDDGRPRAEVVEPLGRTRDGRGQTVEQTVTDPGSARVALDRILIPQDTLDRIAGMVSPRSSLIVSDEELSTETGKDTDFVVVLSGEPQGGIKSRRRGSGI